jgi:4-hydroxyphenylpyruvate dioxygenase
MVPNLCSVHHVELWVRDAEATARRWAKSLGCSIMAVAHPRAHPLGCHSYVLAQGALRIVVTGPSDDSRSAGVRAHVALHGDGAHDVCFAVTSVEDLDSVSKKVPIQIVERSDAHGVVRLLEVPAYGDTVHTLWHDDEYDGIWAPGYDTPSTSDAWDAVPAGIFDLDHANAVLDIGFTRRWVRFYEHVLGFTQTQRFDPDDLTTEDSAVMNRVVGDGAGRIKLPLTEPSPHRPGHVGTFLEQFAGPGIQHLALATSDIVATMEALQGRGIEFMTTRAGYYEQQRELIEELDLPFDDLARLGILVDADDEGSLLQVFTNPVVERPTLFLELIERRGCTGFGVANIRWLAKSAEEAIGTPAR